MNRIYSVCREYSDKLKKEGVRGRVGYITFTESAYQFDKTVSTHRFIQIVFDEIELKKEQFLCEQRLNTWEGKVEYYNKMASGYFDCRYVESVHIHDRKDNDLVEFRPIRVGYFLTIDPKFVIACIDKKEAKLVNTSQFRRIKRFQITGFLYITRRTRSVIWRG